MTIVYNFSFEKCGNMGYTEQTADKPPQPAPSKQLNCGLLDFAYFNARCIDIYENWFYKNKVTKKDLCTLHV